MRIGTPRKVSSAGKQKEPTEEERNAIKYAGTRARIAAMPRAEAANRQHHAMMVMEAIEAAGCASYLDEEKLMCDLCFRPGFERGIMTVEDFEFLGIPTEYILFWAWSRCSCRDRGGRQGVQGLAILQEFPTTEGCALGLRARVTVRMAPRARSGAA